jgi:hypothetical protein
VKWPWLRRPPSTDEAEQASREAGERLEAAVRRWPEVHARTAWARNRAEENHLTEIFFDLRGHRP